MKKNKHLQTNFIKFLLERNLEDTDSDEELELPDFDDEDVEEGDDSNEDDTIEELVTEYRKLKKQYESNRISNRKKH